MPKTLVTTQTVYQFAELSDSAKEKAREWYREASIHDEWWDAVYADAKQCATILGIEIAARNQKCVLIGPNRREWIDSSPAIYFNGFSSQGDGACFEGRYSWKGRNCRKDIRDHAPKDLELHRIADVLAALPFGKGWSAHTKHRGHYYHSGCMSVDAAFDDDAYREAHGDDAELPQADFTAGEETITQAMRDFADWIYRQLEREHDYLNSDEQVDESILVNEYEFTEEGERA